MIILYHRYNDKPDFMWYIVVKQYIGPEQSKVAIVATVNAMDTECTWYIVKTRKKWNKFLQKGV